MKRFKPEMLSHLIHLSDESFEMPEAHIVRLIRPATPELVIENQRNEAFFLLRLEPVIPNYRRPATLSANTHRISNINVAPTNAVIPEGSKGGTTSTTSPPIK